MYEFTKIKQDENEGASPGRDDMMGVIAGLKEAQDELEGGSYVPPAYEPRGLFESHIESYGAKIQQERSRLEKIQEYLKEKQDKVSEKLARIVRLEEALEKTKNNLEAIRTEVSSLGETGDEISQQSAID